MPIKLYTKSGDSGTTGLISGTRLPKHQPIFNLLGDLDELNSSLGLAATQASDETKQELFTIQHTLLSLGAIIAGSTKPKLTPKDITYLEKRIDYYQAEFDDHWYQKFLLPGGTELAARLDLARAICRRSERSLVEFEHHKTFVEFRISNFEFIKAYINRLSDYLFALRCHVNQQARQTETQY